MSAPKFIPLQKVQPPKPLPVDFAVQVLQKQLELNRNPSRKTVHELVDLYTQAIEYYQIIKDLKYLNFHQRMQKMLSRKEILLLFQTQTVRSQSQNTQSVPLAIQRTITSQDKQTKQTVSQAVSDFQSQEQKLAQKLANRKKTLQSQTMFLNLSSISTVDKIEISDEDSLGEDIEEIMERNYQEKVLEITKIRVKYQKEIGNFAEQGQLGQMVVQQLKQQMQQEIDMKSQELDMKRRKKINSFKYRLKSSSMLIDQFRKYDQMVVDKWRLQIKE